MNWDKRLLAEQLRSIRNSHDLSKLYLSKNEIGLLKAFADDLPTASRHITTKRLFPKERATTIAALKRKGLIISSRWFSPHENRIMGIMAGLTVRGTTALKSIVYHGMLRPHFRYYSTQRLLKTFENASAILRNLMTKSVHNSHYQELAMHEVHAITSIYQILVRRLGSHQNLEAALLMEFIRRY